MIGKTAITVVLFAYIVYKLFIQKPLAPIVTIDLGELQGVVSISRDGREYFEYLGIPYAKPPVGALRFEDPEEPEKWTGVRSAGKYDNECIQFQAVLRRTTGDENCLFLNVFTPKRTEPSSPLRLFPTMVFIHGGGFQDGSGDMYRPDYFMDRDVVLVTLNYRLSAFGFLNTGDGVVRGNAGLKDQSFALRFIQRNIANFGGDPKRVLIFGQSAGGISVNLHMLSPLSKGLFHRAISESGNAIAPWVFSEAPKEDAKRFGALVKCPINCTTLMVECLKKLPVKRITDTFFVSRDPMRDLFSKYLPSVEVLNDKKSFLTEQPEAIMASLNSSVPWLTGVNSHEGLLGVALIAGNESYQSLLADSSNWSEYIPNMLQLYNLKSKDPDQLRQYYFGKEAYIDFKKHFYNYSNSFTDVYFNNGFVDAVKSHSQHSPVYAYYFSYPGEFSFYNALAAISGKYPRLLEGLVYIVNKWINKHIFGRPLPHYGVSHGDEMAYLFKSSILNEIKPQDKDYKMLKKMVDLWTSFAYDEKSLKFNGLALKPFDPKKLGFEVLKIDRTAEYINAPFAERVQFLKTNIFKS